MNGEQDMSNTDIKKALSLLKEAYDILKNADNRNLKKSADYLKESIQWIKQV